MESHHQPQCRNHAGRETKTQPGFQRWLHHQPSLPMPDSSERGETGEKSSTRSLKFWVRSSEHFSLQTALQVTRVSLLALASRPILVHDGFEVAAANHLLIEQPLRSFEKHGLSFRQQSFHALVLLIDDTAHFTVDLTGGLLRVVAFLLRRLDLNKEGLAFTIERDSAQLVAHPVGFDHALGNVRGLDQVILRSRGGLAEGQFFRNPPSE